MWEARNGKWPDKLAATPTTETPTDLWSDTKAATLCSPHYTQMFPVYTWAATNKWPNKSVFVQLPLPKVKNHKSLRKSTYYSYTSKWVKTKDES